MNIRSTIVFALLLSLLSACLSSTNISPISSPTITPNSEPGSNSTLSPEPVSTLALRTPTPSPYQELVMTTSLPPQIVLTAYSLQLESSRIKLTEASNQIATMQSESVLLETKLAILSTGVSENSSNQSTSNSGIIIPSNVQTVVTVQKAVIFVANSINKAGAPIMVPYKPRVYIPAGTEAWVYKKRIKADGGAIYYESYDPDGKSELVVYFKANHIQIKTPNGSPDPDKFPQNVAKARITDNTVVFVINGYDKAGKPIMDTYKPYIRYKPGNV
ncbi:MAG: hypothetical protein GWN62_26680, partial [Aliifodinibius sp.]|nr:hypothetical protein [Fodinibius sp.]